MTFDREQMIELLVNNDFDSIMSGDATELLNSYLEFGHKGYRDYTDLQLVVECEQRGLYVEVL